MKKLNKMTYITAYGSVDEAGFLHNWMDNKHLILERKKKDVAKEYGCRVAKLKVTIEEWEDSA